MAEPLPGQVFIGTRPSGEKVYGTPVSPQQAQRQASATEAAAQGHIVPELGIYQKGNVNYPEEEGIIVSTQTPQGQPVRFKLHTGVAQKYQDWVAAGKPYPLPGENAPPGTVPITIGTVTQTGQEAPVVVNVPKTGEWTGQKFKPVMYKISPAGEYSEVRFGFKEQYAEGTTYGIAKTREEYEIMAGQPKAAESYQKMDLIGKADVIAGPLLGGKVGVILGTLLGRYGPELEASQITEVNAGEQVLRAGPKGLEWGPYTGKPYQAFKLSEAAAMPAITKQMALASAREAEIAKIPAGQYRMQAKVAGTAQTLQDFFYYSTPGTILTAYVVGSAVGGATMLAPKVIGTTATKFATAGIGAYFLGATGLAVYETATSTGLTYGQKVVSFATMGAQLYAGYKGFKSTYVEPKIEPVRFEAYPKDSDYLVARYEGGKWEGKPWEYRAAQPEGVGGGTFVLKPISGAPRDWTYEAKIYSQSKGDIEAGNVVYTMSKGGESGKGFGKQVKISEDFVSRVTEVSKEGTLTDIFYYDVRAKSGETLTLGSGRATQSLIPAKPMRLELWTGKEVGLYQPKTLPGSTLALARQAQEGITYGGYPAKLYYVKAETGGVILLNPKTIEGGKILITESTKSVPYSIDFWGVAPVVEGRTLNLHPWEGQGGLELVKQIQPPKGGPFRAVKVAPETPVASVKISPSVASSTQTEFPLMKFIAAQRSAGISKTAITAAPSEGKLVYPPGGALAEFIIGKQIASQNLLTRIASGTASLIAADIRQTQKTQQRQETAMKMEPITAQKITQGYILETLLTQTTTQKTSQRFEQKLQQEQVFKNAEITQQITITPFVPLTPFPMTFTRGVKEERKQRGFARPQKKQKVSRTSTLWPKRDPFTAMTEAFRTGKARLAPLPQTKAEKKRFAAAVFGPGAAAARFGPKRRS